MFDQNLNGIEICHRRHRRQKDDTMNIKFNLGWSTNEDGESKAKRLVLPLCGQGRPEGQASGLMPVKLTSGVTVTPRVTVFSSTSTNRKGAVSAVVKVSIPYTALKLSDDGASVIGVDPNRSGGEISMHTVVNLNSASLADLNGANGGAITANAERQVAILARLHSALMQGRLLDPGFAVSDGTPSSMKYLVNPALRDEYDDSIDRGVTMPSLVPTDQISGYTGNVGFDVSSFTLNRSMSEILTRIAAKQPPLGCSDIESSSLVRGEPE